MLSRGTGSQEKAVTVYLFQIGSQLDRLQGGRPDVEPDKRLLLGQRKHELPQVTQVSGDGSSSWTADDNRSKTLRKAGATRRSSNLGRISVDEGKKCDRQRSRCAHEFGSLALAYRTTPRRRQDVV